MKPSKAIRTALSLAALTVLCGAGDVAPPPEVLGNLTCTLGDKVASETGADAQKILCVFGSLQGGAEEVYEGTAYFPAGGSKAEAMSWIVKGPSKLMRAPGGLEQTYTQGTVDSGKEGPLIGKETTALALHPRGVAQKDAPSAPQASSRASVIDLKLRTTRA